MIEFVVRYEGLSVLEGGVANMKSFAISLHNYIKRNFDEESHIERVKIEGRGPGQRYIKITFPDFGEITTQNVELHDITEEERLRKELVGLYEKTGFRLE